MIPRFSRSGGRRVAAAALCVLVGSASAGCKQEPSAAAQPPLPHPDLCQVLDRRDVETALLGKVAGCRTGGNAADGYGTVFTGTASLGPGRTAPTSLTISFGPRYDVRSGTDRWVALGTPNGTRVPLIGVADQATFDPAAAAPSAQLTALKGGVVLSFGLQVGGTGSAVPQDALPDHLMDLARDTLLLLTPATTATPTKS